MEEITMSQGYKRYIILCNRMEELFDENELMGKYKLNIKRFKKRFNDIKIAFISKDKELKSKELTPESFNHAYDNLSLDDINDRLSELIRDLSDYITPIKSIYSKINTIKSLLELNNKDQFETINELSKDLIDEVDSINNYSDEAIKLLVIEASNVIYDVIMKNSFKNGELINYIKTKEDSICEQLLTSKLRKDVLSKTDKPFFGEIDFNKDIISSVMPEDEDSEARKEELNEVRNKIVEIKEDISDNKRRIRELKNAISEYKKRYSTPKRVGYTLGNNINKILPILTTAAGIGICYGIISHDCETKTKNYPVHIVYNYTTDEVISKKREIISPYSGSHVVCYNVYSKWIKNENNGQYYREVTEYKGMYYNPEFEVTEENLKENLPRNRHMTEYKKELDENDSTEKGEIIVDEYLLEVDNYRPGFIEYSLSAMITILSLYAGVLVSDEIQTSLGNKYQFYKYDENKKAVKLNEEELGRLLKLVEELQSELNASVLKEEELAGYEVSDLTEVLSNKEVNQVLRQRA